MFKNCCRCLSKILKKDKISVVQTENAECEEALDIDINESFNEKQDQLAEERISHKNISLPCIEIDSPLGKKIPTRSIFTYQELQAIAEGDNRLNSFVASSIDKISNSSYMVDEVALNNIKEEIRKREEFTDLH